MKLAHYSKDLIKKLDLSRNYPIGALYFLGIFTKPNGLWISDDDDYGWKEWCEEENFSKEKLAFKYDITLKEDSNVLILSNINDYKSFTDKYLTKYETIFSSDFAINIDAEHSCITHSINWLNVSKDYQGIIITPYFRELSM